MSALNSGMNFEEAPLWRKSLGRRLETDHAEERERLRAEFLQFRKRVGVLVGRISASLPGLTEHELSHLDALWEIGSLLAGPDYPMNPLEAFVFGGSILLHDAGLCFEAYQNGRDGVRATTAWKDAFAAEIAQHPGRPGELLEHDADFSAIRNLHAAQAEELAQQSWPDPDSGEPIQLIGDTHLRKHLGQVIGRIAASHHWNIEDVASRLPRQINAPGEFPRQWRIDPVKIALLLRCADALHVDNRRAPDFFHALLRRQGMSFNHWQAQNRIGRIDYDQTDPTEATVLVTSTKPFSETEAGSWWVAYDALVTADREIRAANALLESRGTAVVPQFRVKRVKGVESPERMAEFLRTEGWSPCAAAIHVSNVERLVKTLGGENLYGAGGDNLSVALRELIQNARDAIRAREALDDGFNGRVLVKLRDDEGAQILEVEDDGVGMSRRVLTGPMLDFGTSFWASSLVQNEFPGLRSSRFQPVGKFGIGFYSVFMVADAVTVTSRRWDEALSATCQLMFKDGVALRPLLKSGLSGELNARTSTRVTLKLKAETAVPQGRVIVKPRVMGAQDISVPFADYVAALVAGLDVDVCVEAGGNSAISYTRQPIAAEKRTNWLRQLSFASYQNQPDVENYISANAHRLRPISENGRCLGLAALSTFPRNDHHLLSAPTIGGLCTNIHSRGASTYFGFIDYKPRSARREQDSYAASAETMRAWAADQLALLRAESLTDWQWSIATYGLAHFGVDPTPIAKLLVRIEQRTEFQNLEQLAELVRRTPLVFFKSGFMDHAEFHHQVQQVSGCAIFMPTGNSEFLTMKMENGVPKEGLNVLWCLHAAILRSGRTPIWQLKENAAPAIYGAMHVLFVIAK